MRQRVSADEDDASRPNEMFSFCSHRHGS
jgi:hypothetical protein